MIFIRCRVARQLVARVWELAWLVFSHSSIKENRSPNAQNTILQMENLGAPLKLIVTQMLFGSNGQIVIIYVQLVKLVCF